MFLGSSRMFYEERNHDNRQSNFFSFRAMAAVTAATAAAATAVADAGRLRDWAAETAVEAAATADEAVATVAATADEEAGDGG